MPTALYFYDSNNPAMPIVSEQRTVDADSHTVNMPNGMVAIVDANNWPATSQAAAQQMSIDLGRDLNKDERLMLANQMRDTALGFVPPNAIAEANQAAASVTYSKEFEKVADWTSENISKPLGRTVGAVGGQAGNLAGSLVGGFVSSLGGAGLVLFLVLGIVLYSRSHVKLKTHTIL